MPASQRHSPPKRRRNPQGRFSEREFPYRSRCTCAVYGLLSEPRQPGAVGGTYMGGGWGVVRGGWCIQGLGGYEVGGTCTGGHVGVGFCRYVSVWSWRVGCGAGDTSSKRA